MKPYLMFSLCALISLVLFSCGDVSYYGQGISGHLSLMSRQQPIEDVIADSATAEKLRHDLLMILEVRDFARDELHLPVADNFRTYVDLGRPYVVWNVVAAPAYSLASYEWCYPVTGCLPYRGYFKKTDAESFAGSLRQRGLDVFVYGVPAYSTLGWFDDPVLNTFIHYPEPALVGLIFHELAHQLVYAESDGDFNEAFATALEREGVRRWLLNNQSNEERAVYYQYQQREEDFYRLIAETREELLNCYDGRTPYSLDQRKACKETAFADMQLKYAGIRYFWGEGSHYDRWFEPGLNNARFISSHTYRFYIPAFEQLLRKHKGDLPQFYQAVKKLAALPRAERHKEMTALQKAATVAISNTSVPAPGASKKLSPKSGI